MILGKLFHLTEICGHLGMLVPRLTMISRVRSREVPPFQFLLPFWPGSVARQLSRHCLWRFFSGRTHVEIAWISHGRLWTTWEADPSMISVSDHHLPSGYSPGNLFNPFHQKKVSDIPGNVLVVRLCGASGQLHMYAFVQECSTSNSNIQCFPMMFA